MKTENNNILNQFIIDVTLVDPIKKIISQLTNNDFRDCDIKWLDTKLENFTEFACKTLDIKITMPLPTDKIMNDYVRNQYLNRFGTLLEYFKSI